MMRRMMTIDNSDGFILHFQDISHGGIWGSEKRDENHRSLGCLSRESQHYRRPRSIIDARPNIFNYYFIKTFAHPYEGNWLCYLFYISLPYFVTLKVPWSSRLSRTHAFLTYLWREQSCVSYQKGSARHTSQMHILETQNWKRNTEKPECSRNSVVVTRLHLQVHRMQVRSTYRQTRYCFNRTFRSWSLPN